MSTRERPLAHQDHGILLGQLALVLAPQARTLPVAISLLLLALLCWRWLLWRKRAPLPSRAILGVAAVMVLGLAAALIWQDGGGTMRDLAVALLGAFVVLKLLECHSLADATMVSQLSFYLLLTLYLSDQPFWLALYSVAIGAWVLRNWLLLHHPEARGRLAIWPLLGRMALIGLPWALVLFVLFPRLEHPLWRLPESTPTSRTGISDVMRPGSVGNLVRSQEVALRAEIDGDAVPAGALYWRALVLWQFDGASWLPVTQRQQFTRPADPSPPAGTRQAGGVDYTVTLEPSQQRWLFTLDRGVAVSSNVNARISADGEYFLDTPVEQRIRYRASSTLGSSPEPLSARTRSLALSLPPGNPRARELAARWAGSYADPVQRVQAALRLFASAPFGYTLQPPPLGSEQVDSFLFETHRGFCEHYSSSFVFLMRAAGVPARVVAGYLGGEYNPIGRHYIVRQADAHAWAEVWLEDRGWVRVDPTSAVAPSRVEQGLDAALGGQDSGVWSPGQEAAWLRNLRWAYDGLTYTWQRWILQYDRGQQERLFGEWLPGISVAQLLACGLAALSLLALVPLWLRRRRMDPVEACYARVCRMLARQGCERGAAEGPQAFAERAAARLPHAASAIHAFTATYIGLRYGAMPDIRRGGELARLRTGARRVSASLSARHGERDLAGEIRPV
jgi:transglutaminase-like putative cysteine protease